LICKVNLLPQSRRHHETFPRVRRERAFSALTELCHENNTLFHALLNEKERQVFAELVNRMERADLEG